MSRILAFTSGPQDWQSLLVNPTKQWKVGYSARTLAFCWEAADGLPDEINLSFSKTTDPLLVNLTPLLAMPEFKVPLPGGTHASQNDVFVLAHASAGPVVIMIEGKVGECFGPTLNKWLSNASPGKRERLKFILRSTGLTAPAAGFVRYQLLHRAASAVITGKQYHAVAAVIVVHSFSKKRTGWVDYESFTRLFNVKAEVGVLQRLGTNSSIPLFGVWVNGNPLFLQS